MSADLRRLAEAGIAGTVGRVTPETWQTILALLDEDALAAERRAMLSLLAGPDDRVTGADYKRAAQTLADYRAEERRATALVEQGNDGHFGFSERGARILNAASTHDGKVDVMDLLHALVVDEEAARPAEKDVEC